MKSENDKPKKKQEVEEITKDWVELNKSKNLRSSKKGNKIIKTFIALLVVLILLIGGGYTYFKFFKPDSKATYINLVKNYSKKTSKNITNNIKKSNESYLHEGSITIDSDMDDYKMLNQISLEYSMGGSPRTNIFATTVDYKEKNKDIFKGEIYIQNDKMYIKSDQVYNKVLYYNNIIKNDNLKSITAIKETDDFEYLINKTSSYIQKALDKAKYKTAYKKINIKGKPTLVQQNIMIINPSNANEMKNEFLFDLKSDDKSIKTISKYFGQNQKDLLTEISDYISKDITKTTKKLVIELNTGILNNKLASLIIKEDGKKVLNVTNSAKNTYKIVINDDKNESISTLKTTRNNMVLETKYKDYNYYIDVITNSEQTNIKYDIKITDKNSKYITISGKDNADYNHIMTTQRLENAIDAEKITESEASQIESNIDKIYQSSDFLKSLVPEES